MREVQMEVEKEPEVQPLLPLLPWPKPKPSSLTSTRCLERIPVSRLHPPTSVTASHHGATVQLKPETSP
ncbi:hypothetical protein VZT92_027314 [Zoarces viviparus]|uniref:Uncharacterized protein n=1 Tax=Zoarces viviparus TaxID=48416 RepID=A0AAW1DU96_ZOAVI